MTCRLAAYLGVVTLAAGFFSQPSLAQTNQTFGQGAVRPGNGVKAPALIHQVIPRYTSDTLHQNIQGDVELEAVVQTDGTVGDVRVARSLDPALDAEAIKAAKQWLFHPGTDRDGRAVPVIVTLLLSFHIGDDFMDGVCRPPSAIVQPTVEQSVEPKYTAEAIRQKIDGTVRVEAVVNTDGTVARARVAGSLDKTYGLDNEALAAAKQYKFKPGSGTCDGQPSLVLVSLTLVFRIH